MGVIAASASRRSGLVTSPMSMSTTGMDPPHVPQLRAQEDDQAGRDQVLPDARGRARAEIRRGHPT